MKGETKMNENPLIETIDLKKYFDTPAGILHAVDGVNLKIFKGRTLGVVGESGCGKSTLGRLLINLIDASDGQVLFNGEDIFKLDKGQKKEFRKEVQIIFQDPYSSLDPRLTVKDLIAEPLIVSKTIRGKKELNSRVKELMDTVGLSERLEISYPHELDGGRRQRIGVARALAMNPKFIVCDEPVSALDVSIQAQVLNLLMDLQENMGLTYIFITHDLSVVKHISHDIAVMYLGQVVERTSSLELFKNPMHPYTKALLASIPLPNLEKRMVKGPVIQGEPTSPISPKPGCRFALRCPKRTDACVGENIPLIEVSLGHFVSCINL